MIKTTAPANEASFRPPEFNDPAFTRWAHRVTVKLLNMPPGCSDHAVRRLILAEGAASTEWLNALMFIAAIARENNASSGA